jgi:hypothetical protein
MPDLDQIKQAEQARGTGADARPSCRERTVEFALPADQESSHGTKPGSREARDIAPAMKAVTSALAGGVITLGEAGTIAAAVSIFFPGDRDERLRTALEGGRGRPAQELGAARRSGVGRSSQLLDKVLLQIRCRSSKR